VAEYHGGCSCGAVRYKLLTEPMFTHACHCHLCQQVTGSAFIIHNIIERFNFKILQGELSDFNGPSGSGRRHVVKRCPKCGDALVSFFAEGANAVVKAGSLDDPNKLPPLAHIFVDAKLEWIELPVDVPQYPGMYDFEETWSRESLQRRSEALRRVTVDH
jgi:hypothetical protein